MGSNYLSNFTYNYGLNYAASIIATYAMVKSGIDWQYNRMACNNKTIAYAGLPSDIVGAIVPFVAPVACYWYGINHEDNELQITALALGQAILLSVATYVPLKALTGRAKPGILDERFAFTPDLNATDFSRDWRFGFLQRGVYDGWPSGHTMTAVAMSVTLAELYPDNVPVKIGAYAYAAFIGAGVSLEGHWLSDVVAGALMGYAIGKTVGRSFAQLSNKNHNYSFYVSPYGVGIVWKF
jgi:membrane-associated phospholipid phosphatase